MSILRLAWVTVICSLLVQCYCAAVVMSKLLFPPLMMCLLMCDYVAIALHTQYVAIATYVHACMHVADYKINGNSLNLLYKVAS